MFLVPDLVLGVCVIAGMVMHLSLDSLRIASMSSSALLGKHAWRILANPKLSSNKASKK